MSYHLTLKDTDDEMTFELLEIPITDTDTEGAVDNVTLDGNVYTDYLYLKKTYSVSFAWLPQDKYEQLRGFYTRQFSTGLYPELTMTDLGVQELPVRFELSDGGIIDNCGTRQSVVLKMRESVN